MNRKFLFLLIVFLIILFSNCASPRYSKVDSTSFEPMVARRDAPIDNYSRADLLEQDENAKTINKKEVSPSPNEQNNPTETNSSITNRMVIYRGHIQIQVVDQNSSYQKLSDLVKAQGGFVESTNFQNQGRRIVTVLRVPVAKFFDLIDSLPELGLVLSRSIQANDITDEFADVQSRLKSAQLLKGRLEKLLISIKDVEEKVKILREINRLAAEIETLSGRSQMLSDRASMSTVTVQLLAEARSVNSIETKSPFGFIRSLNPAMRSIKERSSLKSAKPVGFFDNSDRFKNGDAHQYYSSNGTVLRSGETDNRPTGNASFWKKAFQIELIDNRGYKEVETGKVTDGFWFVYQVHDGLNIYYYGLAYRIVNNKIHLFEAFSPNQDSYTKDSLKMIEFLKSIGGPL